MKVKYSQNTDTLYIEFRSSGIVETKDLDENTQLDVDAEGRICALTIRAGAMIENDQQLDAALERIRRLEVQVAHLRTVETNPVNYHLSTSGFLAEIDRMQLEVREYLCLHPAE